MAERHAQGYESRVAGTSEMPAEAAIDDDLRPILVARSNLRSKVSSSSETLEFLAEYVGHEERRCKCKGLVESNAKEPVGVVLDVTGQCHLLTLKSLGLRSGAEEIRRKR
jgi:hypothetical protein